MLPADVGEVIEDLDLSLLAQAEHETAAEGIDRFLVVSLESKDSRLDYLELFLIHCRYQRGLCVLLEHVDKLLRLDQVGSLVEREQIPLGIEYLLWVLRDRLADTNCDLEVFFAVAVL